MFHASLMVEGEWEKNEVDGAEKVDTAKTISLTTACLYSRLRSRLRKREHFIALDTQWTGAWFLRPWHHNVGTAGVNREGHIRTNVNRFQNQSHYLIVSVKKEKKNPKKDSRSRSVRLQRGTAHIQRSTETRQVSGVMGRTWLCLSAFWRGSHRHASSSFVSVQTRTAQSWHDLARTSVINCVENDFLSNWWLILDIQRQSIAFVWFLIYNAQSTKKVISWRNTSHQTTSELIDCYSTAWVIVDSL